MKSPRVGNSGSSVRGFERLLSGWTAWVERHAILVLAGCLALTAIMLAHVLENLKIDTSTTGMISEDVPFRRNDAAFDRAFPQRDDTIVAVIDAATPEGADQAASSLAAWLRSHGTRFDTVYVPGEQPFFRASAFLFQDVEDLSKLADRLADAQPLLGTLARDPTLAGLASVITQASEHSQSADAADLGVLFGRMRDVAAAMESGAYLELSWLSLLSDDGSTLSRRRFVIAQPKLDYGSLQPAGAAMTAFRTGIQDLGFAAGGVVTRLTGSAALDHEELESVQLGGMAAVTAAFVMNALLLLAGLRSWRLVLATVVTLLVGLVWTAGVATVAVGRLNLISVAFAVLFLGLAVDFSIHICLRYREELSGGQPHVSALAVAGVVVGGAIVLSAVSAAAGFLSFTPTEYKGLAELGVISAAGMFLAVLANLTVLPALLTLLRPRGAGREIPYGMRPIEGFVRRHPRVVILTSLLLGLAGIVSVPFLRFDFDPIQLKDPRMESVRTFLELAQDPQTTPYSIDILESDLAQAIDLSRRLAELPQVRDTLTLQSFVPADQDQKLPIIEDIAYFLGAGLEASRGAARSTPEERKQAHARMDQALTEITGAGGTLAAPAADLRAALRRLLSEGPDSDSVLRELESRLTNHLPVAIDYLRSALNARPVGIDDLPEDLRQQWVSPDGKARVEVRPAHSLVDNEALRRFAQAVQSIAPNAVGTPVIVTEAADVVSRAFATATAIAAISVVLILLVVLRNLYHTLLVLLPLALAAALTSLTAVAFGLSLNFANIIALPLLFGLGVSSAIHVVLRWREEGRGSGPVPSSTSRGVLYSALTTIGAFGSLAISGHRGMASMGYLLTISIGYTLIAALFVLPSLIAWAASGKTGEN